jgi:hypothetical protein
MRFPLQPLMPRMGGTMRKTITTLLAVLLLAGSLLVATNAMATATDPAVRRLTREVHRLENRVTSLQNQVNDVRFDVNDLSHDVFVCEFIDNSTPVQFTDGSTGFPVYYESTCA